MTARDQQTRLVAQFCAALNGLPNVKTEEPRSFRAGGAFDSVVKINAQLGGIDTTLIVVIRAVIDRSDTETLIPYGKELSKKLSNSNSFCNPVIFIASAITLEARTTISYSGFGYYDPTSLLIQGHLMYIFWEPRAKALTELSYERYFSGRRSNVAEFFLAKPNDWFGVHAVATAIKVAASTAADAIKNFEQIGHLISTGAGPHKKRRVKDPAIFLDQWVINSQKNLQIRYIRHRLNPHQNFKSLSLTVATVFDYFNIEYALTSLSAAYYRGLVILEPSMVEFRVKNSKNLDLALAQLSENNESTTNTANITIYIVEDRRDLSRDQKVEHIWISNPLSIYRDLLLSTVPDSDIALMVKSGLLPNY